MEGCGVSVVLVCRNTSSSEDDEAGGGEVALLSDQALQLSLTASEKQKAMIQASTAAEYMLLKRSYHGLEACPAVGSDASAVGTVQAGRSGRAAAYNKEGA
jgi:hypothetical protein